MVLMAEGTPDVDNLPNIHSGECQRDQISSA
jgi:hypothetical protein